MNQDADNLRKFTRIYRNLCEMEEAYVDLEDYGVPSFSSFFVNAYLDLNQHLEAVVNIENLTEKKVEVYAKLNAQIYDRLKIEFLRLYAIAGNVSEVFWEAYRIADNSIHDQLKPYLEKERPFFSCGFSFFNLPVPKHSLLESLLRDNWISMEQFHFENGRIGINTTELNRKFQLTGQEHEIYGKAFSECISFLNSKLHLKGTVESYID